MNRRWLVVSAAVLLSAGCDGPVAPPRLAPMEARVGRPTPPLSWTLEAAPSLYAVWGTAARDVFATGFEVILHFDGRAWASMPQPHTGDDAAPIVGVWGRASDDVYALHYPLPVGPGGDHTWVLRYDGASWTPLPGHPANLFFEGIWGTAGGLLYTVAESGHVARFDGTTWAFLDTGTTADLWEIWGASESDVFVVGVEEGVTGRILHFDGANWSLMVTPPIPALFGVWGTGPDHVLVVGAQGTILRFDGSDWSAMNSGSTQVLTAVWGSSANDVWAVGQGGTLLHFDGASWSTVDSGTNQTLYGVWGSSANDVHVVGNGVRLHGTR